MDCRTGDLDVAIHAVQSIYCPHELTLDRRAAALDTRLHASRCANHALVRLAYGAHVRVDAGRFPQLFLIMRCVSGEASVGQDSARAAWRPGATLPVSAEARTHFDFPQGFSQLTFRADSNALDACCAGLLGQPLDEALRFALAPFSPAFETTWSRVLALLEGYPPDLPRPTHHALEQFVLTSLLTGHPHNYSRWLDNPGALRRPTRLVDRAVHHMHDRCDDLSLTVLDVARGLGVSLRTLQLAFQRDRDESPSACLRDIRLRQVRTKLQHGSSGDTVTDLALAHGFFHLGRFAQHYRQRFGESPSATLRRRRGRC